MVPFRGVEWVASARQWPVLPWAVAVLYVAGVLQLQAYMKKHNLPPMELRWILIAWNATLAFLSAVGALVTLPHLLFGEPAGLFVTGSLVDSVCAPAAWYRDGAVGLTMMSFVHSKYFELIDTVFLVLRKKRLTLLHVMHHSATLLLCQRLYTSESSTGLIHGSVNLMVHAIMYTYYMGTQFHSLKPWLVARGHFITQLQLAQMVLGVVTNLSILISILDGNTLNCAVDVGSMVFALTLYVLYLVLFANFYTARASKRAEKKL